VFKTFLNPQTFLSFSQNENFKKLRIKKVEAPTKLATPGRPPTQHPAAQDDSRIVQNPTN
jgi:hypothetical protein